MPCGALKGLVFATAILSVGTVCAEPEQGPDPAVRTAARELATQGAEAYERREFSEALERLNRAFALYPVPSISVMQARCLVQLGRWVEALDKYESTRRMPLSGDAAEAMRVAVRDAGSEADALRSRIPKVTIEVRRDGQVPPGVVVELDGRVLPRALLDVDCPLDPGAHVVVVREGDHSPVTRKLNVGERERVVLAISLNDAKEAVAPVPETMEPAADEAQGAGAPGHSSRFWWGVGSASAGAGAVVASTVIGVMALNRKAALDEVCDSGCPVGSQGKIDDFRTYRTVSYVSGAAAVVLAGVGGYLIWTDREDQASASATLLPNGIAVTGRF